MTFPGRIWMCAVLIETYWNVKMKEEKTIEQALKEY